jgi:hypothetical protein
MFFGTRVFQHPKITPRYKHRLFWGYCVPTNRIYIIDSVGEREAEAAGAVTFLVMVA